MDDRTLASLRASLSAPPADVPLRLLLLKGLMERGLRDEALQLASSVAPSDVPDGADRIALARALLALGKPDRALEVVGEEGGEALLLRARICKALKREREALDSYLRAVASNILLEDDDLRRQLEAAVSEPEPREKAAVIDRAKPDDHVAVMLTPEVAPVTFAEVGGLDDIKEQIRRRIILPFQKPALFARFRRRAGGGILLFGPPGCGKTLLARATAGECGATFFNVDISDVLDMYIGEAESRLHALFERARASAPAVLFFDEVEALGGKRQYSRDSVSAKIVSQLLAEMDGFAQGNAGVLIVGATNVPWAVDPAFRRPGRFDRFLFVPPPDRQAREAILRIHLAERPAEGPIDVAFLANHSSGFSGADLMAVVETAVDTAIAASVDAGREVPLTDASVKAALREVKPTTLEWLSTARNHARYANEGGQYDEVLEFLKRHGKA